MRNPLQVLEILESRAKDETYRFDKLIKNFYNIEFYQVAYAKIYAKERNMTEGTDYKTIDGFSLKEVENLIETIKNETYQPNPVRRVEIPKKNSDKKRPLGIPAFYDQLVQQVMVFLLEAIYEPVFEVTSHGYRPNKSCHTALNQIKHNFTGTKWWIEGNIKGFFDNINHDKMIELLRKRIKDGKFLRLIRKFLNNGYLYEKRLHKTYAGTPQGSIVSPILANIYLNELDKEMNKIISEFSTDTTYRRYEKQIYKIRTKLNEPSAEERKRIIKEIKELQQKMRELPSMDQYDENYKKLKYVRYADDFVISVIGSKADAQTIKERVGKFLKDELHLDLSEEKTLITHNTKKIRFLGYDIFVGTRNEGKISLNNVSGRMVKKRVDSKNIKLSLPHDKMKEFLMEKNMIKITNDGRWKANHRPYLLTNDPLEILRQYNAEFSGLYQYYKLAFDVKEKLGSVHQLFANSFAKTLAGKHKTKVSKIRNMEIELNGTKYKAYVNKSGNWGVNYINSKGYVVFAELFPFRDIKVVKELHYVDPKISGYR